LRGQPSKSDPQVDVRNVAVALNIEHLKRAAYNSLDGMLLTERHALTDTAGFRWRLHDTRETQTLLTVPNSLVVGVNTLI